MERDFLSAHSRDSSSGVPPFSSGSRCMRGQVDCRPWMPTPSNGLCLQISRSSLMTWHCCELVRVRYSTFFPRSSAVPKTPASEHTVLPVPVPLSRTRCPLERTLEAMVSTSSSWKGRGE